MISLSSSILSPLHIKLTLEIPVISTRLPLQHNWTLFKKSLEDALGLPGVGSLFLLWYTNIRNTEEAV